MPEGEDDWLASSALGGTTVISTKQTFYGHFVLCSQPAKRKLRSTLAAVLGRPKQPQVPRELRLVYQAVTELTDRVCHQHLTDEYGEVARALAATLCRKRPYPPPTPHAHPRPSAAGR